MNTQKRSSGAGGPATVRSLVCRRIPTAAARTRHCQTTPDNTIRSNCQTADRSTDRLPTFTQARPDAASRLAREAGCCPRRVWVHGRLRRTDLPSTGHPAGCPLSWTRCFSQVDPGRERTGLFGNVCHRFGNHWCQPTDVSTTRSSRAHPVSSFTTTPTGLTASGFLRHSLIGSDRSY